MEKKDVVFIEEKNYQQIKKKMRKNDDYFTLKEIKNTKFMT